jgi:hypothetical protein
MLSVGFWYSFSAIFYIMKQEILSIEKSNAIVTLYFVSQLRLFFLNVRVTAKANKFAKNIFCINNYK